MEKLINHIRQHIILFKDDTKYGYGFFTLFLYDDKFDINMVLADIVNNAENMGIKNESIIFDADKKIIEIVTDDRFQTPIITIEKSRGYKDDERIPRLQIVEEEDTKK